MLNNILAERIKRDLELMAKTVCIDFDGVIHPYTKGWIGLEPDDEPPVAGIKEEIIKLKDAGYRIVVLTTRAQTEIGTYAVKEYLFKNNIYYDAITATKIGAIAYIDDRAIPFNGNSEGLAEKIKAFKSWNEARQKP